MPNHREVSSAVWAYFWAISQLAGHELAGDVGHPAKNDFRTFKQGLLLVRKMQLPAELFDDFVTARFPHRLVHEITHAIAAQSIAPKRVGAVFLPTKMWLME